MVGQLAPSSEPASSEPASSKPASSKPARSKPAPPGLGRRVIAGSIDVTLIAACTAVIASTQAEQLAAGPLPLPEPTAAGPYLTITLGDTVHRWAGTGLWVTFVGGLLATLIVAVGIPANTGGSSPGLRAVRLRVEGDDGARAGLGQHLIRTVFAAVDLAPWVVPGLAGWVLARRSPRRQRLGDRLARTVVTALPARSAALATTSPVSERPEPAATLSSGETHPAVGLQRRESARYPAPSHRAGAGGAAKASPHP